MDGARAVGQVADAITLFGLLPWKVQNPAARALGHLQEPFVLSDLVALNIRVTNQRSPNDDRVILGVVT